MFINNNYVAYTSTRPPYVKLDNNFIENDEKIYTTSVDQFDEDLYQTNLKSQNLNLYVERNYEIEVFKFKHSENLHYLIYPENISVEMFDCLSNRKPFTSTQPLGKINFKTKFKLQLNKIYKNNNGKGIKTEYIIDEETKITKNQSMYSLDIEDNEKEKNFFNNARMKNTYKPTTHLKQTVRKGVVNLKFEGNLRQIMQVEDSVFHSCNDVYLQKNSSRPQFVEDLFNKYDYQDIDPWKKVQNRTKDKSLCLSVIQDVYNKIKNFFG